MIQHTFVTCNAPCTRHTLSSVLETHRGTLDDEHTRRFLASVSSLAKHAKPSLKSIRDGNIPLATRTIKATSPERMLVIATATGKAHVMGFISANASEWNEPHLEACWGNYKHRRGNPTVAQKEDFKVQYDPKITTQIPVQLPANNVFASANTCLTLWSPDYDTQQVLVVTNVDGLPTGCVLVKGGIHDGHVLHTPYGPVFDGTFHLRVGLYEDIGTWSIIDNGCYTIMIAADHTKINVPDSSVYAMSLRLNAKKKRKSTARTSCARTKKPRNNYTPTKKRNSHSCFDGTLDIMQLFEQIEDDNDAPVCIDDLFEEEDSALPLVALAPPTMQTVNILNIDKLSRKGTVAAAARVLNDLSSSHDVLAPSQRMTATVSLVEMPSDLQQRMTAKVSLVEMPHDLQQLNCEEKGKQPPQRKMSISPSSTLSLLSDTDEDETAFTKENIDAFVNFVL